MRRLVWDARNLIAGPLWAELYSWQSWQVTVTLGRWTRITLDHERE